MNSTADHNIIFCWWKKLKLNYDLGWFFGVDLCNKAKVFGVWYRCQNYRQ